jgi:hypothetical protein
VRISLVPAFQECGADGSEFPPAPKHRGAVSRLACYSPRPESAYLTVGSPEFNGQTANSIGFALFKAKTSTPEDGLITVNLTDVRCAGASTGCSGALADYSGSLLFETNFRITDRNIGPTGVGLSANGTATDMPMTFAVPCATTASGTVGSTCSVSTSLDAVLGGATAVDDSKRAIWEMRGFSDGAGVLKLWDGGSDGNGTTVPGNTLYMVGGLFFP